MYGCLVLLLGSCSRFTDPNRTTKAKPHQHKTIDPESEQNTKGNDIHYTSRTKLKPMTSSKQTRRSFKPQPVMNFPPKNNPLHTEALQHSKHPKCTKPPKGPKILIWEFPKIRGTLSWGPYNKDPTIWDTILGSPIFGNSHIGPMS